MANDFNAKKYLLDGEAVGARDIIKAACSEDEKYRDDWMHSTSQAAAILRGNGHTVGENPEFGE